MTRKMRLIGASLAAALLAWPAVANQLLNERWLATASYEQVQKAIAGGADVGAARSGYTPLMVASRAGNHDAIRALCEGGADGNKPAKPGQHGPLHFAADAQVVALLFDCGALVWSANSYGSQALHYAAGDNRTGAIEALIGRGADPNARDNKGHGPLHMAARSGAPEAARVLLAGGADPNAATARLGNTPLHEAAVADHPAVVQILVAQGADVDARDGIGNAPLHDATEHASPEAVQILLKAGADVNARNRSDVTPLHKAARHGSPEVVQVLLEAGADPTIHANTRYVSSMVPSPAEAARGNRKLRGHPVMARLEAPAGGKPAAATTLGCDGYIVLPTDRRLGDVALKVLGDRSRWTEIARLNGISAENPHRVGQCLALP